MYRFKRNIVLSVIASFTLLSAQAYKNVEVYSTEVKQDNNVFYINNGIVVEYDGDIIRAQSGVYNKDNSTLTLKGNATLFSKSGKKVLAKEFVINLDNNNIDFKNFFQIDKEDIWITSTFAKKRDNIVDMQNALVSSCSVQNPDWMIGFDKAVYDTKTKELKLSDAKVYVKDVPIFYFPYLKLPLSKERRSGLLRPKIADMSDEGILYNQPYFWAIDKSQDLEIDPQVRTKRGYGVYATYRFYHKKDAYGVVKAGYFKDKKKYTNKYNIRYNKHYGAELYYKDKTFIDSLSKDGYQNALYLNGIYLTDKDYINLQNGELIGHHGLGNYYESRANLFVKNNYFYSGINLRYFKNLNSDNNKDTLHILPNLHFHLPYSNLIYNNLLYSVDLQTTNYTRNLGNKAFKVEFEAPLELHYSLLNDYLSLNLSETIDATAYDFYNVPIEQKKYNSVVANHKISLISEVSKVYDSGIHTAMFSLDYTKSSLISEEWMKFENIPQSLKNDFIDDIPFDSKLTFRTHQFWSSFDKSLNIDYILSAHYYLKENKLRDIKQEIDLKYKNWSLYSSFGYSFLYSKTTGIYNKLSYDGDKYGASLAFYWKKDYQSLETISKELSANSYYNYNDNLKFRASANYDVKNSNLKNWEVGSFLDKHCWSIDLSFGENIKPIINKQGQRDSISNKYIRVELTLLPFGLSYAGGS